METSPAASDLYVVTKKKKTHFPCPAEFPLSVSNYSTLRPLPRFQIARR